MDFLPVREALDERAIERVTAPTPPATADASPTPALRIEEQLREELAAGAPAPGAGARAARPPAPVPDPLDEFFWRADEEAPCLPDILGAAAMPPPAEVPEVRREWLTFLLGGEEYGIPIEHVREILRPPVLTEVPRAPAHVLGVIMVRGEVIAVIDPRHRLGAAPATADRKARVVVCDPGDGPRGLLVDAVAQVVRLAPSSIEARPNGIGGASADHISGIGRERGRLLVLLDTAALLGDAAAARPAESDP